MAALSSFTRPAAAMRRVTTAMRVLPRFDSTMGEWNQKSLIRCLFTSMTPDPLTR